MEIIQPLEFQWAGKCYTPLQPRPAIVLNFRLYVETPMMNLICNFEHLKYIIKKSGDQVG